MKRKNKIDINNTSGNVIISQNQRGGSTSYIAYNDTNQRKGKKLLRKWDYAWKLGLIASILTILGYFGLTPIKDNKMIGEKKDTQVAIGSVLGDVVISQNQSGGITAHSVNINNPANPEWFIGPSEKITNNEWRTKLSAIGKGNLAYYNWNILLTLNTPVIRREDVPGEVTVGPWMPLKVKGGNLQPNHFFIGFSEFKPGQAFSIYLYSKEPLKVLRVDTIS